MGEAATENRVSFFTTKVGPPTQSIPIMWDTAANTALTTCPDDFGNRALAFLFPSVLLQVAFKGHYS